MKRLATSCHRFFISFILLLIATTGYSQFPSLSIGGPPDGAVWDAGESRYISWTSTDVNNVVIRFSNDGGNTHWETLDTVPASNGQYQWLIPDSIHTTQALLEVQDAADPTILSQSGVFSIINRIQFYEPDLTDTLTGGSSFILSWKMLAFEGNHIKSSIDSGQTWKTLTSFFSDTTYSWNVPDTASNDVFIVGETSNGSDTLGPLTIVSSGGGNMSLSLSTPGMGDSWATGDTRYVGWTSSNVTNVIIEFSGDGGTSYVVLDTVAASQAEYGWTIPDTLNTSLAYMRVTAESDHNISDVNGPFSIIPPFFFVEPDENDTLQGGTTQKLSWKMTAFEGNVLEFSLDSGNTWNTLIEYFSDTVYYWTVPDTASNEVFILGTTYNGSDTIGPLTILPSASIEVMYPDDGVTIYQSSPTEIRWLDMGLAPSDSLEIAYSARVDSPFTPITRDRVDSLNGSYLWNVPDTSTHTGKIGIRTIDPPGSQAYSKGMFSIISSKAPSLSLTHPTGNYSMRSGRTAEIRFQPFNIPLDDTLAIYFSPDAGKTYQLIRRDSLKHFRVIDTAGESSLNLAWKHPWYVPFEYTDSAIIEIRSGELTARSDTFGIGFKTNPSVTFTNPSGGASFLAGEPYYIQWEAHNLIPDGFYKLFLRKKGDPNWSLVDTTSSYQDWEDQYSYHIPSYVHGENLQFLLVEESHDVDRILGISDTFSIQSSNPGTLEITNTQRSFTGGDTLQLEWDDTNLEGQLMAYYQIDSGGYPYHINFAVDVQSSDSLHWIVPSINDDTVAVYLRHSTYRFLVDSINISIEKAIPGVMYITSPNQGDTLHHMDNPHDIAWGDSNLTDGYLGTAFQDLMYEYSLNGGKDWNMVTYGPIQQPVSFYVPPAVRTDQALFRIRDVYAPYEEVSDTFAIWDTIQGTIELTFPAGGEQFTAGRDTTIRFNTNLSGSMLGEIPLQIYFSKNGDDFELLDETWMWSDTGNVHTIHPDMSDITSNGYIRLVLGDFEDQNETPFTVTDGTLPYLYTDAGQLNFGSIQQQDKVLTYHLNAKGTGNPIQLKLENDHDSLPFTFSIDNGQTYDTVAHLPAIREIRNMPVMVKMRNPETAASVSGSLIHASGSLKETIQLSGNSSSEGDMQVIPLAKGWNILSVNRNLMDADMMDIVQPLIDDTNLVKVQDQRGNAIEKPLTEWINDIGTVNESRGYKIKVHARDTLMIQGDPLSLPVTAYLRKGWNVVGMPFASSRPARHVFAGLIRDYRFIKAQDEAGAAMERIEPLGAVDNLDTLHPGEGYQVKIVGSGNFSFGQSATLKSAVTSMKVQPEKQAEHFSKTWNGNGLDHMNIYLSSVRLNGKSPEKGDEIAVFDGNRCVGFVKVADHEQRLRSLIASKDDPTTGVKDGYTGGERMHFKIWDASENKVYDKVAIRAIKGNTHFRVMGTGVYELKAGSESTDINSLSASATHLGNNYPNPFTEKTRIYFSLDEKSMVRIAVYDLSGKKVHVLTEGTYGRGVHKVSWKRTGASGSPVPEGIYIYEMQAGDYLKRKKMVVE